MTKSSHKRILVTGSAGFLGSHLCESLVNLHHHVIGFDNLSSGNKENLDNLLKKENFEFIEGDVVDQIEIECDEIYNLACPASPVQYQSDPIATLRASAFGAYNLLELAKKNNCKIFHASTSEIYGDPLQHPQKESYWGNVNPIGIRSCYDEGKRVAETLFFDYNREFDTEIKVGRIFNTYGPRMLPDDGRVVSNFIVQAINQKPITIYGKGTQTRSFCYVDDLIEAFILFMETEKDFSGPLNLGNPNEFSIIEIAKTILNITESNSEIIYKPLPLDDPRKRRPDISLARNKLNWIPKIPLEEGLKKTIEYFKS